MTFATSVPFSLKEAMRQAPGLGPGGGMPGSEESRYLREFVSMVQQGKRLRDAQQRIHEEYYAGNSWFALHPFQPVISMDYDIMTGVRLNYFEVAINHAAATLMGVEHIESVVPTSDSPDDELRAELGNALLSDHAYRSGRVVMDRLMAISVLCGGNEFSEVYWDPNQIGTTVLSGDDLQSLETILAREGASSFMPVSIDQIGENKFSAAYRMGGTAERRVSAELMMPEPGITRWEDVRRFAVVRYPSVADARLLFPDAADRIKPMSVWSNRSAGMDGTWGSDYATDTGWQTQNDQTRGRYDEAAGVTRLVEYWEMNDRWTWDRRVYTGASLEHRIDEKLGIPKNPFVGWGFKPIATTVFWCKGLGNDLRNPQFTLNKLRSRRIKYANETLKDTLLLPEKSEPQLINNRFRQIIRYRSQLGSQAKPEFIPVNYTTLSVLAAEEESLKQAMWEVADISSAARGQSGDRASGKMLMAARQSSETPLLFFRQTQKDSARRRGELVLDMSKGSMPLGRFLTIVGDYSESAVKLFDSGDYAGGTSVVVTEKQMGRQAQESNMQIAEMAAKSGLLAPGAESATDRYLQIALHGEVKDFVPKAVEQARRQARDEQRRMQQVMPDGMPRVVPTQGSQVVDENGQVGIQPGPLIDQTTGEALLAPYQNDPAHMEEHTFEFNRPGLPQWYRQLLGMHMQETEARIKAQEEAARQAAIQMKSDESVADNRGPLVTGIAINQAKQAGARDAQQAPGTPRQGGVASGEARSAA